MTHVVPTTYDDNEEHEPGPALMELVTQLDERWRCWQPEYDLGFTGWLDADEATAFAALIPHTPVETYEGSSHASYHRRVCALADHAARTQRGLIRGMELRLVSATGTSTTSVVTRSR